MANGNNKIIVYQGSDGAVEVRFDETRKNIFLTQPQIGKLFDVQKAAISKHVNNIFATRELDRSSTVSKMETVQNEGGRWVKRKIEYYNLDLILSIGYRVNSKKATKFRQWATKTLRQHILQGYTINKKRLTKNYQSFLQAVDNVKKYLPENNELRTSDVLDLVKLFASTWLSLDTYDKSGLPTKGSTKRQIDITSDELTRALFDLKTNLIDLGNATNLFGQGKQGEEIDSIVRNILQSYGKKDLYPTLEEKAAHLLYFIAKGHPFVDGNKRSGAFAFIWFLKKANILNVSKISPEALTALTLLVAESNPKDKEKIIGLILMLIKK